MNGTLKPITPRTRSGRKSAAYHAKGGAPIVSDDHRCLCAYSIEQADHVANKMEQRVPIALFWAIRLPVASHIGRDRMKSSLCERMQLMAPRIP
jgi:hypothetical protein